MELLKSLILVLVAIVFILVLIGISWKILNFVPPVKEYVLQGDKQKIESMIADLVYNCYIENEGKRNSVVCSQARVESSESIASSEIIEKINLPGIDKSKVIVSDISPNSNIIIRYENDFIYVEVIKGERVGS